ncbi:hydrogenase maturation protease [Novosphingobium beihaiensis]|uniref:Hydrogenase maturation protease n=1 Tax=Novosphingobium beihaiensis TaxID=2930389 RepID=A0ABT0BMI1_9SPHN|nr:hydrogenase maturation protease [Novosphingobium beihaiensis]MCJ2186260.1 hydrogenase maturation protease [Novosphingobium beihaiensis]
MSRAGRGVLVLCIGNPDRGDDGAGPAVAKALEGRLPPEATLAVRSGDMLAMIEDWEGFYALVCLDAASGGGEPGRIHRIDLAEEDLPGDMAFLSSHAFGLGEGIALARTLDLAPPVIIVYAVEGRCFDGGTSLSEPVAAAVAPAAERIIAEVARLQEAEHHA